MFQGKVGLGALQVFWGAIFLTSVACTPRRATEQTSESVDQLRASTGLVVSQIYGGAGAAKSRFNRDFVELFNRSTQPVSLAGLQIHFAGGSGDFALAATLPDGATVPPGGYYLVGFAAGEAGADVRVDAAGSAVNVLPVNGKVALVKDAAVDPANKPDAAAQQLGCGRNDAHCTGERIVDLVGYGVASDHEGTGTAPAPSVALALHRKASGCTDRGDNANDFEAAPPAPRTAQTLARPCPAGENQ